MRSDTLIFTFCLIGAIALCCLPGCDTTTNAPPPADVFREAIAQAQATSIELDQVIADAQAELQALPEGEQRDELLGVIAKTTTEKARVDGVLADLQTRLEAAGEDADVIDAAAIGLQGLGSTVPPPWGLYLTSAGGVLLAVNRWLKARRTQQAATSVIQAIEHEKANGQGKVDFDSRYVKTSLRSRMSNDALELVENARDKVGVIGIPVVSEPLADAA